ncbi:hypothetical protein [Sulfuricurvum sp.]|uniref:hypothetical protein n=1 Tax=Sulfuricurvum sp. TaxID=2025608 RepID=UPI003BB4982D
MRKLFLIVVALLSVSAVASDNKKIGMVSFQKDEIIFDEHFQNNAKFNDFIVGSKNQKFSVVKIFCQTSPDALTEMSRKKAFIISEKRIDAIEKMINAKNAIVYRWPTVYIKNEYDVKNGCSVVLIER